MKYQIYFDNDYDKWVVEIRQSSGWATYHQLVNERSELSSDNYLDALYEMTDLCVEVEDIGVW